MVKVEKISDAEAEEEFAKTGAKGAWKTLIEEIQSEGTSRKVTGLTRGQVAALYRSARDAGLKVKTSYKEGSVVLSPASEEE